MNCKMKVVIIYTSVTGNTKELAEVMYRSFLNQAVDIVVFRIEEFPLSCLRDFDALAIGTYTWGNGEIPKEMHELYHAIEDSTRKNIITAVFGTGDSFYSSYCGAVDLFRDMLYVHTNLAATLKVELLPQIQDLHRCEKFVESIVNRVRMSQQSI